MIKNLYDKYFIFICLLCITTLVSCVSYICSFFELENNILTLFVDLFSHWQIIYLYSAIILFIFSFKKYKKISSICLTIVLCVFFSSFYQKTYLIKNSTSSYKIISSNVLFTTNNLNYLDKFIKDENPDLIYLMEINHQHIEQLKKLSQQYNYHLVSQDKDYPFGYALLSKTPLDIELINMPEDFIYFEENDKCVALVHLMPPISIEAKNLRDTTFNKMFSKIQTCNKKISLIAGDFNASSWSYPLTKMKKHNYYSGSHIKSTWPTLFKGILGIPIDHILVNQPSSFKRYEIINPENGSDHYTLIAEI